MKRIFTIIAGSILFFINARAAIVTVNVVNFQFSPANVNVKVGDVVRFNFTQGFHNATSSGAVIPAGAPEINSGGASSAIRTYDYTVTVIGTYNYYCIVHGDAQGNGMVGKFTASAPLPIVLKDLFVTSSANTPVVKWVTTSEQNVKYFSVRSSTDGKEFTEIGQVAAKGNSAVEQQYSFTDKGFSQKSRYLFYELVTVDRDGSLAYSAIKTFKTAFASSVLVMQLSPNPIQRPAQLMIQFNAEKAGAMKLNVYDAAGKLALRSNLAAVPGLNNGHVHVCDLAPGVYTLQFSYEGLTETKRLVVN